MKRSKRSIVITWLTCLSVMFSLCAGIILIDRAKAAPRGDHDGSLNGHKKDKVASDLREKMRRNGGRDTVKVIVQLNDQMSGPLKALLNGNGVKVKRTFNSFNAMAVELPASVVDSLASFPEVEFASVDSDVRSMGGHIARTTGADNVRSMGSAGSALDGSGIAIAVLDSGIFAAHDAFGGALGAQSISRVIVSKDFTGEGRTDDPYGHGTHVAAAAGGNGVVSQGKYIGIAPKAKLINLRVLNSQGMGNVSSVLAGLDWIMANRLVHNIRVVNMSLGMPAVNSYRTDPICVASRHLVDAGIVVVAAAGNNGKNNLGEKL
jgi:serine protease AprX